MIKWLKQQAPNPGESSDSISLPPTVDVTTAQL